MSDHLKRIEQAVEKGELRESSARNILEMLVNTRSGLEVASVGELMALGAWEELNDRFYKTLTFGTGGLRGRTIGRIVTKAEQGNPRALGRPEFPCVGTNAMNFYNISRATQGLVKYLHAWYAQGGFSGRPKIVVAHDTRHFSEDFTALVARVATELGCDVCVFSGPRSTPQLSFSVRAENASAGIVITASHNPFHDNGFKVYFSDGAQVVEPHASGIIAQVEASQSEIYLPLPEGDRGLITILGEANDEAYMIRLETLILDRGLIAAMVASGGGLVYTSIHGVGGQIIKPMLDRLGFRYACVPAQEVCDGRFPTVKSPNPENAEALTMALALADQEGADLVMATDPDADRMGVAVRNRLGRMELLSGNQIGSLMAYYRVNQLIAQGVVTPENANRAVIVKTFLTTDLQKAIADDHGMRCVETLTGFKYIGEKLGQYEGALPETVREGYRERSELETRTARLADSSYYVCGGEESYGYSAADFVRDKDANGSVVVFSEVAAYAQSRGMTLLELLDEVYIRHGFYAEKNGALTFEGADGSAKIHKLVESYAGRSPESVLGSLVTKVRNFATEKITDSEGWAIPAEKMLMFDLSDGRRVAVRPSGTEPKIKFYLFARRSPEVAQSWSGEDLVVIKREVLAGLDALWDWVQKDVDQRLGE